MGYATLAMLGFTAVALLFGAFFGMIRGRNRAILRLILVIISVVVAIALRGVLTDILMDIDFGEGTLKEMLMEAFTSGDTEMPESMINLIFVLVEIIIGIMAYFVAFIAVRFVSWMLLYPILKIFVKKGSKKRKGWGALIGLLQGVLVAFFICSPITGLAVQVDALSKVEMEDKQLIEIPEEVGLSDYTSSSIGKLYSGVGGWYFDLLASAEDETGKEVSLSATVSAIVAVLDVAESVSGLGDSMDTMTSETATPQEKVDAMKSVGDKLIEAGNSLDGLSEESKEVVNDLLDSVKDMVSEEDSGEMNEVLENLNLDNLDLAAAGGAINGIATYIEKTSDEFENDEPVNQEEVNAIIGGLAENFTVFGGMLEGDVTFIEVDSEHAEMFETAIAGTELSAEDKDTLRTLFGL